MIPSSFQYQKAQSIEDAISVLQKHGYDAKILAGGHSLIPAMKLRLNMPAQLIDIRKLAALKGISEANGQIIIGAAATHYEIATSDLVSTKLPMLAKLSGQIGDVQVRYSGTIGGSVAHADPAADWPAGLLATKAILHLVSPNGERQLPISEFFTGIYMTALEENELIKAIAIPIPPTNTSADYHKFVQPASRFAIVGCAVSLTVDKEGICEEATVAFTGVADTPFIDEGVSSALVGKKIEADTIAAAVENVAAGKDILSDHFASEPYRKHLARVYASRAISAVAADFGEDDLTKIEGIGPKISEILKAAGIRTFARLAATSTDFIKTTLKAAGNRYAVHNPKTWLAQAQLAADGKWDELKAWQDELDGGV